MPDQGPEPGRSARAEKVKLIRGTRNPWKEESAGGEYKEMDKPCGCPPGVCDHGMGDQRDPWYSTMGLFPPVRAMSQRNLNAKTERGPTGVTMTANPITWGQIKKTTQEAEKLLERQGQAKTPDSMFLAMLAVVSCASIGSGEPPTSN